MKKNKGITLIALVITIIVMLILAGVVLNLTIGERGIFTVAKNAKEESEKETAIELLNLKILDYQTDAIAQNRSATLEGLKEYLKKDSEIQYTNLYIEKESLEPVTEGEIATHAKIKLAQYRYEFTLDAGLNIIQINGNTLEKPITPTAPKVEIDGELEALLKEANMTITLEDIINTPAIMEHVNGLIPTITESDVTRSEENGVITYQDTFGGTSRVPSEDSRANSYRAWFAVDDAIDTFSCSVENQASGWYFEYEFKEKMYVCGIRCEITNGSMYEGTRVITIQGYDEENSEWQNLAEDFTWIGTEATRRKDTYNLNYAKPYKKYRLYVKSATYASHVNGGKWSGLYSMQLYGCLASSIQSNSEENLKQMLLSNSNIDKITLNQMVTNKDFTKRLLDALSIETVTNNETLMTNLYGLIPTLTADDVTRSVEDGVITYQDTFGGTIRVPSEDSRANSYRAWFAVDDAIDTFSCSADSQASGWYFEYEFKEKMYACEIRCEITNASVWEGTRVITIQGYDEENSEWQNLTEDLTWIGKESTRRKDTHNLNYAKPYKKYRLYVKSATYTSHVNGGRWSGLYTMQLYGKACK